MSFNVNSTVKLNMPKIDKLSTGAVSALEKTGAALLSEIKNAEVFPFETGNLQDESTYLDTAHSDQGVVEIISDTPYARRLYYHPEYNFNRKFNTAARAEWFVPWLPGGSKEGQATKIFAEIYKKENGL